MTVKDRIMEFCRMSGIKPGRFERECGLSNAYLSKLKHEPSRDKLGKIFARYPELNKDWLLNGEGPMLNVVHYPAMEGGNELLVNDQAYYVGRPAGSDEVLIPRDAWEVIKKQADSFKERDEYEGENETYIEASVENSSSILYDKEIRNKPRTRRTKRNV